MATQTAALLLMLNEQKEKSLKPHHIVWDERVLNRVSITDRYLYDLPFFAEIFNALDAHWKPKHADGWHISDCHSLNDLFVVYGTRSKRGLRQHFEKNPHWLPMLATDDEADALDGPVVHLHRVITVEFVGFVRVWLDNKDAYSLDEIGRSLARGPGVNEQVWALTPFYRRIRLDGYGDEDDGVSTTTATTTMTTTGVKKENKHRVDERQREEDAVLVRAANEMRDKLSAYLQVTRDLRNAMALSPLASSDLECCAQTRQGMTLLYEELGNVEDQIENIARCQVRFCKLLGQ